METWPEIEHGAVSSVSVCGGGTSTHKPLPTSATVIK